ncbi:hypothetical protein Q3G72_018841 [Acer saccharum]|nr:hypothetical protein Q3G72_018841 [Acer saccharum]
MAPSKVVAKEMVNSIQCSSDLDCHSKLGCPFGVFPYCSLGECFCPIPIPPPGFLEVSAPEDCSSRIVL